MSSLFPFFPTKTLFQVKRKMSSLCSFFSTKTFFQVNGVLELDETPEGTARYSALDKWTTQLSQLQKIIVNRMT
jgi:hypothetical protein